MSSLIQERFAPDASFRYVGGDPSLDFVNTVNWTTAGLGRDRFSSYDRLLEWARGAGVIGDTEARRLAIVVSKHPQKAAAALEAAREAREVLHDVFASLVSGQPSANAIARFNELLGDAATHLRLVHPRRGARSKERILARGWEGLGDSLDSMLWPVIWAASDLVSSSDVERLRVCAGEVCGWLYVDRSRNGLRRWCEMSVCGTREKNRRRASR